MPNLPLALRLPSLWLAAACLVTGCSGVVGDFDDAEGSSTGSDRPGRGNAAGAAQAASGGSAGKPTFPGGGGATTSSPGGSASGGSAGFGEVGTPTAPKTVRQPLRPLTPFELDNALRDLVNDQSGAALGLRTDDAKKLAETAPTANAFGLGTFRTFEDLVLVATRAYAASPDQRLSCAPGQDIAPCTETFLRGFLRKAFRRKPTETEVTRYAAVRSTLEPLDGRAEALARTLQAVLMSPSFLYLTTLGPGDAAAKDGTSDVALTSDELAAHLAFFLWASLPDAALLDAADSGKLATDAGIEAEVDRLLKDARAENAVGRFLLGWLGVLDLPRAKKTSADWSPALARSMQAETGAFVRDWFTKGNASVSALLSADYTFVDASLASFYGLPGVTGQTPVKVQLAADMGRRGVLSQASWLAAHGNESGSGPIHRGQWIWEHALCGEPREAPANAVNKAPVFTPDLTTRQWNESIATSCGGKCHQQMGPLGYVYEGFDSIGKRRTTDNGKPVVTKVTLETGFEEIDRVVEDNVDFTKALADSDRVTRCVAEHWLAYALAVPRDALDDETRTKVATSLDVSGREAMRAIAVSPAFRLARRTFEAPVPGK